MSATNMQLVSSSISYFTLLRSVIRSLTVMSLPDNPLVWNFTAGRRNKDADVEGPFYVIGSPSREIEKGKAIMAPISMLKKCRPFLMTVRVVAPDGSPIPGAVLDWWQADSSGGYYFWTYTLRGRVATDDQGYAEVLTVVPAPYGAGSIMRAGHFHLWVHAPAVQSGQPAYDDLTTQIYVCNANDVQLLKSDFVNYMRGSREWNMTKAWSIPDKDVDEGRPLGNFPELLSNDEDSRKRVNWWNVRLVEMGEPDLKVAAGGTRVLHLNPKGKYYN